MRWHWNRKVALQTHNMNMVQSDGQNHSMYESKQDLCQKHRTTTIVSSKSANTKTEITHFNLQTLAGLNRTDIFANVLPSKVNVSVFFSPPDKVVEYNKGWTKWESIVEARPCTGAKLVIFVLTWHTNCRTSPIYSYDLQMRYSSCLVAGLAELIRVSSENGQQLEFIGPRVLMSKQVCVWAEVT